MRATEITDLLDTDNLFIEENEVRMILRNAIEQGRALEVGLEGSNNQHWSRFVKHADLPGYDPLKATHIVIAPLEPDPGATAFSRDRPIKLTFSISKHTLEVRAHFLRHANQSGTNLIHLTFPKIVNTYSRRKLVRHQLPEGEFCQVEVKTRLDGKRQVLRGRLFDIHTHGMAFHLPNTIIPENHTQPLYLSCTPGNEAFDVFTAVGRLCYRASMRSREDASFTQFLYGCQFVGISSESIQLDRYVSFLEKEGTQRRKRVNLQALVDSVFSGSSAG